MKTVLTADCKSVKMILFDPLSRKTMMNDNFVEDRIAEFTNIFVGDRQITLLHFYRIGPNIFSVGYKDRSGFYYQEVVSWGGEWFTKVS